MTRAMTRTEEIRFLNDLPVDRVIGMAGERLQIFENAHEIDLCIAELMFKELTGPEKKSYIFPYGPVGEYPLLVDMLNSRKIPINADNIFFMDEYADQSGKELPETHPLSFKGGAMRYFKQLDTALLSDKTSIVFPSSGNITQLSAMIRDSGGIAVCFGGIGIHGHMAFNEPAGGVRDTDPNLVDLNKYTVTINAVRESTGGNIYNFPKKAYTLGMNQIMESKRIILSCRNGLKEIDWANTVLRIALLGQTGDDFPVTWLRTHKDYLILTDRDTLKNPVNRI